MRMILPDKEFFSIGEVAKLTQLPAYVLRYWETEFNALRPLRRDSKHRKYTKKEIEQILEIKELLYDKKYTIEGARKILSPQRKKKSDGAQLQMELDHGAAASELIRETKKTLQEIYKLLK